MYLTEIRKNVRPPCLAHFVQDKMSGHDNTYMLACEEQIELINTLSAMGKFTKQQIDYIFSSPEPKAHKMSL